MKSLQKRYRINAKADKVWQALTDPHIIEKWGGGPADMSDEEGTDWKLWDGDIHGKNVEVIPEKRLVQEWYGGSWPEPSICTFELVEEGSKTDLILTHNDIPDDEFEDINTGWDDYYLSPLKELVEK